MTSDKKIAKISLLNVLDQPGIAAQIFKDVSDKDINIRLIIQSAAADHRAGITFIIEDDFADAARKLVADWKQKGLAKEGTVEKGLRRSRLSAPALPPRRVYRAVCSRRSRKREQRRLHQLVGDDDVLRIALEDIDRGVKAVHDEFFANAPAARVASRSVDDR